MNQSLPTPIQPDDTQLYQDPSDLEGATASATSAKLARQNTILIGVVSALVLFIVLGGGGVGWYVWSQQPTRHSLSVASSSPTTSAPTDPGLLPSPTTPDSATDSITQTASPLPTASAAPDSSPAPTASPTPRPTAPDQVEFRSTELGISFLHRKNSLGTDVATLQQGNTVFVYDPAFQPDWGQFVTVFEKPASESITQTITRMFLAGKDPERCYVVTNSQPQKGPSIVHAEIAFPINPDADLVEVEAQTSYCSPEYARTNGIRYFYYDENYPDRFVFFSIGQYMIQAEDELGWQDTLEFIE